MAQPRSPTTGRLLPVYKTEDERAEARRSTGREWQRSRRQDPAEQELDRISAREYTAKPDVKVARAAYSATPERQAAARGFAANYRAANPEKVRAYRQSPHARQAQKEYRERNKDRIRAGQRKWLAGKPDYLREKRLAKYGLTPEGYDELSETQNGCCAICGIHQSELPKSLVVDHDHDTDVVRGLLCSSCNLALGHVKDSPRILVAMVAYLEDD